MIEQVKNSDMNSTGMTDLPTVGEDELRTSSHKKYSISAKSLMEEDEEEEDEGGQGSISRNPSLVDDDGDRREHDSDENERKGPSHLERKTNREKKEAAISERPAMCAPSAIIPMCQGDLPLIPGCQGQTLAEQIDFMTQCRHPLELFSAFHEHPNHQDGVDHNLLPGMYSLPKTCEYCGATDSDYCTEDCQRPKSFFRKKRPPFCPRNSSQWDPATGFVVAATSPKIATSPAENEEPQILREGRRPSFMGGLGDLFRKPSSGSSIIRE